MSVPQVYAVDSSHLALAYAWANAKRLGLEDAVTVVEGSWCTFDEAGKLQGTCGVVVSNPPYIPSHKLADLQLEVSRCCSRSPQRASTVCSGYYPRMKSGSLVL
jgi:methylase of polypeptide subunit release factors